MTIETVLSYLVAFTFGLFFGFFAGLVKASVEADDRDRMKKRQ